MPAPVYMPDGRPSASPSTTSISDTPPGWADHLAGERQRAQRHQRALARELHQVRAQQVADVDVFERRLCPGA